MTIGVGPDPAHPEAEDPGGRAPWRGVFRWIGSHRWSVLTTCGALVAVVLIYDPFRPLVDDDLDVASQWSKSIARIGVTAVYPPQEDFHVGDVLLAIEDRDTRSAPVRGSIRVGHVDVRETLLGSAKRRIGFASTVLKEDGTLASDQAMTEADADAHGDGKVRLMAVAFPTVSVMRDTRTGASFGLAWGFLGASRRETKIDDIEVPGAMTYGIDADRAHLLLREWCSVPANMALCRDADARVLMAHALDPAILDRASGDYRFDVGLRLVTRVYLTRSIKHRVAVAGARDGAGGVSRQVAKDGGPGETPVPDPADDGIGLSEREGSKQGMSESYAYPVVFGYRSFNVRLRRDPPT